LSRKASRGLTILVTTGLALTISYRQIGRLLCELCVLRFWFKWQSSKKASIAEIAENDCGVRGENWFAVVSRLTLHLTLSFLAEKSLHFEAMSLPPQPNLKLVNDANYRESYANSVQMRVNIWDFFLVFGTLQQQTETQVEIRNFQGVYLSPQQAKALLGLLQQNVAGYESAFGEIKLDPRMNPAGPVH